MLFYAPCVLQWYYYWFAKGCGIEYAVTPTCYEQGLICP